MLKLPDSKALIQAALREDLGRGDLTTRLTVDKGKRARAVLLARRAGVAAGLPLFAQVFRALDATVDVRLEVAEGGGFARGAALAHLSGPARSLLSAERVALNFAQRLCGIATLTRDYVRAARKASPRVQVLDTRKTTPLLRRLEKYAVACGGGVNHRAGLDAAVLIKDNHIKAAGSVAEAVLRARQGGVPVEVEVENLEELVQALKAGADTVLLDNFSPARLKAAVDRVRRHNVLSKAKVLTEASGGVTLRTIAACAASGVDRISVGALTHSAPSLDLSMEFEVR